MCQFKLRVCFKDSRGTVYRSCVINLSVTVNSPRDMSADPRGEIPLVTQTWHQSICGNSQIYANFCTLDEGLRIHFRDLLLVAVDPKSLFSAV
jgi:hypothetical protein